MTYDLRTHILCDFTNNKDMVAQSLQSLIIPTFSDTNLFDALYETLDRVCRIEGRKYIILIGSGRDTFSKLTLDKILARVKATREHHHLHHRHWRTGKRDERSGGGMGAGIREMELPPGPEPAQNLRRHDRRALLSAPCSRARSLTASPDQRLHPQPVHPHLPSHQQPATTAATATSKSSSSTTKATPSGCRTKKANRKSTPSSPVTAITPNSLSSRAEVKVGRKKVR